MEIGVGLQESLDHISSFIGLVKYILLDNESYVFDPQR